MPVNFDLPILRDNTHSVKYDGREAYFGTRELQPLWVADMDFAVPECISQALQQRLAHPIYGYSIYPESVYEALIGWFARRHRWSIVRELPCIRLRLPEATFLLWLDCRAMGLSDAELQRFFIEECQLGLSPGRVFGAAGSGFMRLNIGAPRAQIMAALAAIKRAWLARD